MTTTMMMLTMKQDPATECETSGTPYVYTIIQEESTPVWNQIQRREKRKTGNYSLAPNSQGGERPKYVCNPAAMHPYLSM